MNGQSRKIAGNQWRVALFCFVLLHSTFCLRAMAQSYSIDWFKVAGGGGVSSNSQPSTVNYQLSGTIGQPDAGQMSGGNYTLDGGFWATISAVQTPGAPLLTITLNAQLSTINISWPSPSTGFVLQQNTDLSNPNGWSAYGGTINDNGTTKNVTINPPAGNAFFRLKK